jgi:hypothetical protein
VYGADAVQVVASIPSKFGLLAKCRHLHLELHSRRTFRGVTDICLEYLENPDDVVVLAIEENSAAAERVIGIRWSRADLSGSGDLRHDQSHQ